MQKTASGSWPSRAHSGQLWEQTRSELPFIVYEDERLSFEETWQQASRIGALLALEYGVEKGDRIAISMRNYPEWILAFMAATSVGAIAVAMNAHWQPDEMAYALEDSGARVLFADEERLERLSRCKGSFPELGVLAVRASQSHGVDARPLDRALAAIDPAAAMPAVDVGPDDDATILYTSGSTGHPKGAISCHRNVLSALLSWELDFRAALLVRDKPMPNSKPRPARQAASLLAVPLFHATGSHAVFLSSYRAQRRIVSMYRWDVDRAAELIEREQITQVVAPAAVGP